MKPSKMKIARIKKGISQTELAEGTKITQQKISNIERGLVPNALEAAAISIALGNYKLFNIIDKYGE